MTRLVTFLRRHPRFAELSAAVCLLVAFAGAALVWFAPLAGGPADVQRCLGLVALALGAAGALVWAAGVIWVEVHETRAFNPVYFHPRELERLQALLEDGQVAEADARLTQLAEACPGSLPLGLLLARTLEARGDEPRLIRTLQVVGTLPCDQLVAAMLAQGGPAFAERMLSKLLEGAPHNAVFFQARARLRASQGEQAAEQAKADARKARELAPEFRSSLAEQATPPLRLVALRVVTGLVVTLKSLLGLEGDLRERWRAARLAPRWLRVCTRRWLRLRLLAWAGHGAAALAVLALSGHLLGAPDPQTVLLSGLVLSAWAAAVSLWAGWIGWIEARASAEAGAVHTTIHSGRDPASEPPPAEPIGLARGSRC